MSDMTLTQTEPKTDAEYEAAFESLLQEMSHIEAQMQSDRAEIERLRVESQMITARTDAQLAQLERQLDALQKRG